MSEGVESFHHTLLYSKEAASRKDVKVGSPKDFIKVVSMCGDGRCFCLEKRGFKYSREPTLVVVNAGCQSSPVSLPK